MVTDEYCFAEVGLPCLNSSAIAFGSMLYNSCCVLFCSIKSSCVNLLILIIRCYYTHLQAFLLLTWLQGIKTLKNPF